MTQTPTARQLSAALRKSGIPFAWCRSMGRGITVQTDGDSVEQVAELMVELYWSVDDITSRMGPGGVAWVSVPYTWQGGPLGQTATSTATPQHLTAEDIRDRIVANGTAPECGARFEGVECDQPAGHTTPHSGLASSADYPYEKRVTW